MKKLQFIVGLISCVLSIYSSATLANEATTPKTTSLKVALYPYVPRLEQFKASISEAWDKLATGISLDFVASEQWDGGYTIDPNDDIDIFVFESIFLDYFKSQGYLEALKPQEIAQLTEIPSQVIEDIKIDDKLYSIPQTGCLNLLFYRKNDQELQQATTLTEVQHIIGQCPYSAEVSPPENEGLLINFSDPTMTACLYLEAVQDLEGQYTATPTLPTPEQLNAKAITHLQQLLSMSYKPHALKESAQRAQWFAQGLGRAFWGFSESILAMKQNRENIAFKLLPLSAQKTDIPLLYVEMIGINPSVTQRGLRAQALKAANLIAAHEVLLNSLEANEQHPDPQYLLPMHQQTLNALKSNYPVYQQFYQLMQENKLRVFRLGTQSRAWFNTETQKVIQETVLKKSCPAEVAK